MFCINTDHFLKSPQLGDLTTSSSIFMSYLYNKILGLRKGSFRKFHLSLSKLSFFDFAKGNDQS
ncbi:hypothetical protein CW304_17015 [Bacillus sp. UFRGS-B20]|nr:hypothetical protein CW304_17015 [Bacillus sp. UFRGS-B20]